MAKKIINNNNNRELSHTFDLVCKLTSNLSTPFHNFIFNESETYSILYYKDIYRYKYDAYIVQSDNTHVLSDRFIREVFLDQIESRDLIINRLIEEKKKKKKKKNGNNKQN